MYDDVTEPLDRLDQLKERHAELLRAMAETGFDHHPPSLRDRNGFFNALLNGERDALEQVRPRWQEYKLNKKRATHVKAEIDAVVRQEVASEPGYRALVLKAGQEKRAKRSCKRLIESIRLARQRIVRANANPPDTASHAVVKRGIKEVTRRLQAVQRRVGDLTENLADQHSFPSDGLTKLHIEYSRADSHEDRRKQFAEIRSVLRSLESAAKDLRQQISAREKEFRAKQRTYMKDGQRRYNRPSDGRG
jgi:hypothetical protein